MFYTSSGIFYWLKTRCWAKNIYHSILLIKIQRTELNVWGNDMEIVRMESKIWRKMSKKCTSDKRRITKQVNRYIWHNTRIQVQTKQWKVIRFSMLCLLLVWMKFRKFASVATFSIFSNNCTIYFQINWVFALEYKFSKLKFRVSNFSLLKIKKYILNRLKND